MCKGVQRVGFTSLLLMLLDDDSAPNTAAQVAAQEGKYLAKLLSRYVRVCAWACGFGGAGLG